MSGEGDNSDIVNFRDEHRFLSNFSPCDIVWEGGHYPSVEHAYQAMKASDGALKEQIRQAPSAGKAKKLGGQVPMDAAALAEWDKIKVEKMLALLRLKFADHWLKNRLLATGDRKLVEGNWWGDRFWGAMMLDGKWDGDNHLGRLLMQVRDEIRNEEKK
jgi:ribA/ribD-fused uncharacterized protein